MLSCTLCNRPQEHHRNAFFCIICSSFMCKPHTPFGARNFAGVYFYSATFSFNAYDSPWYFRRYKKAIWCNLAFKWHANILYFFSIASNVVAKNNSFLKLEFASHQNIFCHHTHSMSYTHTHTLPTCILRVRVFVWCAHTPLRIFDYVATRDPFHLNYL